MHKLIKYRLIKFIVVSLLVTIGVVIILTNLRENIIFFYTPSEIPVMGSEHKIRIGGLVKANSIQTAQQEAKQLLNIFILTDDKAEITVKFAGTLPMLFRERQGIVAQGYLKDNYFLADIVLAKHDERYMPKELADKLKAQHLQQLRN